MSAPLGPRAGFWQGYRRPQHRRPQNSPYVASLARVDAARWATERWLDVPGLEARIAAEGWERSLRLAVRQAHERGASEAVLAGVAMRSLRWVRARLLGVSVVVNENLPERLRGLKRVAVSASLPPRCRECGAECEIINIAKAEDVEAGDVLGEVRCGNGHVQLYFLKAGQDAIDLGAKLAERYGRGF